MQRMAWTDERLEERFDRVEDQIVACRDELRGETALVQVTMSRARISIVIALIGVIAAVLVKGA